MGRFFRWGEAFLKPLIAEIAEKGCGDRGEGLYHRGHRVHRGIRSEAFDRGDR